MKALWIAASLGLMSSVALAQSANKAATSLDTCFKVARVTEESCAPSANDAERQECLQNARKMQRVCLELAGSQPAASADRPPEAASPDKPAEAASPEKSAEAVPPAPPASPPEKVVEPEKAIVAAPPVTVTAATPARPVAQGSWTVSEMASPVDYSPVVTATIRARSENRIAPAALVVRCRSGSKELSLRMEGIPRPSRGGEVLITQQLNDQPAVKSRWTPSVDGKTANYREDATALLQSFADDARLKIVMSDGSGRDSEAVFQLAGWNATRDKIAAACKWTATASTSLKRQ